MKLHCNENGEQYVINLLSRTNSILTHYYVLSAKNEGKVSAHPHYEGWNFNSGNYLFTTDTK